MRDAHPEVYKQAVDAGRAHPMPNLTYKSAWGDSLKTGSEKYGKHEQGTTYQRYNNEVFKKDTATMLMQKRFVMLTITDASRTQAIGFTNMTSWVGPFFETRTMKGLTQ